MTSEFIGPTIPTPGKDIVIVKDKPDFYFGVQGKLILDQQTQFQRVTILDNERFGRCVFLDGQQQSAEVNQENYHEALVRTALLAHENPKRVLIIGGGEGAALWQTLNDDRVEEVVMVDIDGEFLAIARNQLRQWHKGAFDDRKAKVYAGDGWDYLFKQNVFASQPNINFDIIIRDLTDAEPEEGEHPIASKLFTQEFDKQVNLRLNKGGIYISQSETVPMDLGTDDLQHLRIETTMQSVFKNASTVHLFNPFFHSVFGYTLATDGPPLEKLTREQFEERKKHQKVPAKYLNDYDFFMATLIEPPIKKLVREKNKRKIQPYT